MFAYKELAQNIALASKAHSEAYDSAISLAAKYNEQRAYYELYNAGRDTQCIEPLLDIVYFRLRNQLQDNLSGKFSAEQINKLFVRGGKDTYWEGEYRFYVSVLRFYEIGLPEGALFTIEFDKDWPARARNTGRYSNAASEKPPTNPDYIAAVDGLYAATSELGAALMAAQRMSGFKAKYGVVNERQVSYCFQVASIKDFAKALNAAIKPLYSLPDILPGKLVNSL